MTRGAAIRSTVSGPMSQPSIRSSHCLKIIWSRSVLAIRRSVLGHTGRRSTGTYVNYTVGVPPVTFVYNLKTEAEIMMWNAFTALEICPESPPAARWDSIEDRYWEGVCGTTVPCSKKTVLRRWSLSESGNCIFRSHRPCRRDRIGL